MAFKDPAEITEASADKGVEKAEMGPGNLAGAGVFIAGAYWDLHGRE